MKNLSAAILSVSGTTLTDEEKYILENSNPVGIALFSRNIKNKEQLKKLIKEIKETIGRSDVLISVDQEGGRVRRLTPPEFRSYAAKIEIASLDFTNAQRASELHAQLISDDFHKLGINVNFAPCLDRIHSNTTEALKSRCFSSDTNIISNLGKIMVDTYIRNGILPCIKHLPGHGSVSTDPHLSLPTTSLLENNFDEELKPFIACNHSPLAMTAHILIPFIDNKNPLSQSNNGINELIRKKIGFKGFLISDSIDMHALKGTLTQKAKKAIEAGCDCICYSLGNIDDLKELNETCPKLSDASYQRMDKALQILHNNYDCPNIKNISEEYSELIKHISHYEETYDATEVLHKLQTKE